MNSIRNHLLHLKRDESGQLLVFTALIGLVLVMFVSIIYNVGVFVGEKMKVQDAADAAAYSQAVWEARTLNYFAYTNRTMISYLVAISFLGAIQSQRNMWQLTCSVTGWIPYWNVVCNAISTAYNIAANATGWMRGPIYAMYWILYVDQFSAYSDMLVNLGTSGVMRNVVGRIDGTLRVNQGGAGGIAVIANVWNYMRIINPFANNFNSTKYMHDESRDGYSAGTSFPRTFWIYFPPLPPCLGLWARAGPSGFNDFGRNRIRNTEGFRGQSYRPNWLGFNWRWRDCFSLPIPFIADNYNANFGDLLFVNYNWPGDVSQSMPSVYSVVTKPAGSIPQIAFDGLFNVARDINAVSRAQVFYWDPDRNRDNNLSSQSPPRSPNLFNPFWRARLAQMDFSGRIIASIIDPTAAALTFH